MSVYYEGSPKLGYASRGQIREHVEQMAEEDAATRLFDVMNGDKTARLAKKAFRQMVQPPMSDESKYCEPRNGNQFLMFDDDSMLGTFAYEVGRRDEDEDLGDLINLDFLIARINGDFALPPDIKAPHFTAQVKPIVESFLEERTRFMDTPHAQIKN